MLLPIVAAGPVVVGLAAEWSAGRDRRALTTGQLEAELAEAVLPVESRLSHLALAVDALALHWSRDDDADRARGEGHSDLEEHWRAEAQLLLAQWPEVVEVYRLRDMSSGRRYSQVRRDWSRDQVLRAGSGPSWAWGPVETAMPSLPRFHWAEFESREWMWWSRPFFTDDSPGHDTSRLGVVIDAKRIPLDAGPPQGNRRYWLALLSPSGQVQVSTTAGEATGPDASGMAELESLDWRESAPVAADWLVRRSHSDRLGFDTILAMDPHPIGGGPWRNSILVTAIMLLATLLSSLVIGHLVGRVSRPLDRLGEAMQRVAAGDLHPRLEVSGSDEMAHLVRSFNSMVTDLHTTQEAMTYQRQALSQALREAESVERMKDDFLALVSHEVRTPLTTILGGIEFLLESFRDQEAETEVEFMAMVQTSAQRLRDFMNDAILMANLQAKRGEEGFEEFSLQALIEMELDRVRPRIADMDLVCEDRIRQRHELFAEGDWTLFQVAIAKLLDNACRHNRRGGTLVVDAVDRILEDDTSLDDLMTSLGLRQRCRGNQWWALRVMNSGPCLSAEEIPALFRRFELSHDIDHHQRGSGLSLPIVGSIVEYHGGSVQARGVDGQGMAFYVVLSCRNSGQVRPSAVAIDDEGIDDVVRMARQLGAIAPGEAQPSNTTLPS